VNIINSGQDDQQTPLAMVCQQMSLMNIWNVYVLGTHDILYVAIAAEVGISPQNMFCILTEHMGK
jgi:hypothetical protein